MDTFKTGNLIKELRCEKGLTQKELAEKISVSTAAVSKWENGKGFPDISILEPLSAELGISITELIKGEKDQIKPESDSVAKDIIEISKKEIKSRKNRNIFVILMFIISVTAVNAFVIYDAFSGYRPETGYAVSNSSFIGLFMFLFGANAVIFAIFNLVSGKNFPVQKAMQTGLFSEACCAASIWLGTVFTNYKVSVGDIPAVLDTANAIEIYSRILFLSVVLINVFAFWHIAKK